MKYKLINKQTGEEHICSKETVNGFDFYIGGVIKDIHELNVWDTTDSKFHPYLKFIGTSKYAIESFEKGHFLKVIATNDPSKEIPQMVDEVEEMAKEVAEIEGKWGLDRVRAKINFLLGYDKSQQSHPHSDDDVVEFNEWLSSLLFVKDGNYLLVEKTTKELLQLWKEQKIKTIYYDNK